MPWFALGRRATGDVLPFGRLGARCCGASDVDVLHAHMFGSNVWGTVVGRAARVPVVVAHEQTWDYEGQPLRKLLDGRLIGRHADAFVAVSTADRDRMVALEGVPEDKLRVELNAYVPRTGPRPPARLREELGLRRDPLRSSAPRRSCGRRRRSTCCSTRSRACATPRRTSWWRATASCRAALERARRRARHRRPGRTSSACATTSMRSSPPWTSPR